MKSFLFGLLQTGIVVSLVSLLPFLLRKVLRKYYPARAMCFVWMVLAVRLLIPVQLTFKEAPVQVVPRTNYVLHEIKDVPQIAHDFDFNESRWVSNDVAAELGDMGESSAATFDVGPLIALIWAAGAAAYLIWQLICYSGFRRSLARSGERVEDPGLLAALEKEKRSLSIKRDVPLIASPAADCPMLAGFVRPSLYIPGEGLAERDAGFIFRHELTHYKNGDLWLKLLLVLAKAAQWFNPLIYLMSRFANEDIELACDAAVAKNMDTAERKAYGETILRSVAAQAGKRELVSCFNGDKETIMRRFEGLFDKTVKKRGAALVLVMVVTVLCVGAAFSIGNGGLTDEGKISLAEEYARSHGYDTFTVKLDGERVWLVSEQQPEAPETGPYRAAEEVHFTDNRISGVDTLDSGKAITKVNTFEQFRILFENDLGLPDPFGKAYVESFQKYDEPGNAGELGFLWEQLQIDDAAAIGGAGDAVAEGLGIDGKPGEVALYVVSFPQDGSEMEITMLNHIARDWTGRDGKNSRTPSDLARQLARGVEYKSGQFVYPILSRELQEKFIEHQKHGGEEWYWKLGGSSPSYRDFVLVPAEEPNVITVVFQKYGGGLSDARSAFNVTTGVQDGRSVITRVEECVPAVFTKDGEKYPGGSIYDYEGLPSPGGNYTCGDIFNLYYNTGLAWPGSEYMQAPYGGNYFNGADIGQLKEPVSAAEAVFGYCGNWVTMETPEGSDTQMASWIKADKDYGAKELGGGDVAVRILFDGDGSEPVCVRMRQSDSGLWFPVGLADNEGAGSGGMGGSGVKVYADIAGSIMELPSGETLEDALSGISQDEDKIAESLPTVPYGSDIVVDFKGGAAFTETELKDKPVVSNLPLAEEGALFSTEPLNGEAVNDAPVYEGGNNGGVKELPNVPHDATPALPDKVSVEDVLLSYALKPKYDSRVNEVTELIPENGAVRYTVEGHMAALLSSTMEFRDGVQFRSLKFTYELSGEQHTLVTVFRAGYVVEAGMARVISDKAYTNQYYGYKLTLPDSFVKKGYSSENDAGGVRFGMIGAYPEMSAIGTTGTVMTMNVEPTGILKENFGDNWEDNYIVPCKKLAERNGMAYFLTFASDVQYDPANKAVAEAYNKMYGDALKMDESSIEFLETDKTDEDVFLRKETETRLISLGSRLANEYMAERHKVAANAISGAAVVKAFTVIPDAKELSCQIVYSMFNEDGCNEFRNVEKAVFGKDGIDPVSVDESYASSANKGTTAEKFLLFYNNDLGLPICNGDEVAHLQILNSGGGGNGVDLSSPEKGAMRYGMSEAYATYEGTENISDDIAEVTYNFWELNDPSRMKPSGDKLKLKMRRVQLDTSLNPVWLAEGWEIQYKDGTGLYDGYSLIAGNASRYAKEVYANTPEYYRCRTTGELFTYLELDWTEGEYNKGRLYSELYARYVTDPGRFEDTLNQYANADGEKVYNIAELWSDYLERLGTGKTADNQARFSEKEIKSAYKSVTDYAAAHGFSVNNLRYDASTELGWSRGIMTSGVLSDNLGLSIDDVITVMGDAVFGADAHTPTAEGWSFTLYRDADGDWILEDGAFGY